MILVERHYIKSNNDIVHLCSLSAQLYNKCNYLLRQAFFNNTKLPNSTDLWNFIKNLELTKQIGNTKTACQINNKLLKDWNNFFKALKAYSKNSKLFKGKPKPPNYKNKLNSIIFYNQILKKTNDNSVIPTNYLFNIKTKIDKKLLKQVVVTPKSFGFIVDIQYDKPVNNINLDKNNFCSIDLGIDNLCTVTSNKHLPILINGKILKSINQFFNKRLSKSNSGNSNSTLWRKRYFRTENYFHHVSKLIIDNCIKHNLGTIIIGKNIGWKNKGSLGKITNQKFQGIAFNNLIHKIKYKAELNNITVIETEESYTSQSSFLDNDILPTYPASKPQFSGKRISRGLYRTAEGSLINADVNGSYNIGKKVIGDTVYSKFDSGIGVMPLKINPLTFRSI